jgi:hypothetical protein
LRIGRTRVDMDAEVQNIRSDSGGTSFNPAFAANFRSSTFDFQALNKLLPKPLPMAEPIHLEGFLWGDMRGHLFGFAAESG